MAYLTAKTTIEESTGLVTTTVAGHMALHNDKAKAVNSLTEEVIDSRSPALATPAETATSVPDLLGQFKQMLKNITGETNWFDSVATTLASVAPTITSLLSDVSALIAKFPVVTADIADAAVTAGKIETQEAWNAFSYSNGWVNFGSTYGEAGYYKDSLGIVHLRGLVKSGTTTTGTVMIVLPEGYRIDLNGIFSVGTNSLYGDIYIDPSGNIRARSGISSSWVSLGGIVFKAA